MGAPSRVRRASPRAALGRSWTTAPSGPGRRSVGSTVPPANSSSRKIPLATASVASARSSPARAKPQEPRATVPRMTVATTSRRLVDLGRPAQREGHGADQHELHDDHRERGRRLADQQAGAAQGSGSEELQDPGAPLEAGGDRGGREGRGQDRQGHHPGRRLVDLGQPESGDADQDGDRDDQREQELLPVGHQLPPLEPRLRPPPGASGGGAGGRCQVEGHLRVRSAHACACPSAVVVASAGVAPPWPAREVISK